MRIIFLILFLMVFFTSYYLSPFKMAYSQEPPPPLPGGSTPIEGEGRREETEPIPIEEEGKREGAEPAPLQKGIDLLKERRFDEALTAFRDASLQDPDDPEPHYFSALAYQAKRDLPSALAEIQKAIDMSPEDPLFHLRMGIILEEMRRLPDARSAYMRVFETPEAKERGEESPPVKEARERIRRLDIREHFEAAKRFMRKKGYEDAIRELDAVLAINPGDFQSYYLKAMALKEMERPKEAIEALKKVVEIKPDYADAYLEMGFIYEGVLAFTEALESLEKFLSLAPQSPRRGAVLKGIERSRKGARFQKLFETVGNLIKEEKWDEALRENKEFEGLQPEHPHVFYNYGVIYSSLNRNEEAIVNLQKAIEKEPKLFLAHQRLAVVYEKMGKFSDAIPHYEAAQANTTDEEEKKKIQEKLDFLRPIAEVPERAGKVFELLEKNDIEGAIEEAKRLIAGRKRDPKVYLILVGIYMQANRLEEAAKTLETAISIGPKNVDVRRLLSDVYEKLGREEEAIASYKVLAELAKGTAIGRSAIEKANLMEIKLHFAKAVRLKEAGDLEGALRESMAILSISPDHPIALFNTGVLHDLLDHPREAVSFLGRTIEVRPDYVEAYLQLGLMLEREMEFTGAEEAYRGVMRLQKEGDAYNLAKERLEGLGEVAEVTERLKSAKSLLDKKDFEGALREAQASIALYPRNYLAYFYMGIIYDQTDRPDDAISALQSTMEIKPGFLPPYMLLGKLLVSQEKIDEARETYRKVVDTWKGTREADMAAVMLKRLRPWRGNFSFNHSYNTNISYGVEPKPNYTSGYSLSWMYEIWRTRKGGVNAGVSGSESVYYNNQLSGYGYTLYIKGDYKYTKDSTSSLNLSQRKGYFEGRLTSEEYTLNINGDYKYSNDKVFSLDMSQSWGRMPVSRGATLSLKLSLTPRTIPDSISLGYRFSKNRSFPGKASDADRHTLSVNLGQNMGLKDSVTAGYSFSVNRNNNPIGNNYGNRSHTVSLGYNRILPFEMRGGISYSIGFVQYMNPDSTSLFKRFRENIDQNIGGRLSFPLSEKVSFSFNYTYSKNRTSLPRPSAELRQTLEEFLSEPIPVVSGGYERHAATMSIGVSF